MVLRIWFFRRLKLGVHWGTRAISKQVSLAQGGRFGKEHGFFNCLEDSLRCISVS